MWTLERVRTGFDIFYGPQMAAFTWMLNLECWRETTSDKFALSKFSQGERQIKTNSGNWGISRSLQQKNVVRRKVCQQCWYQKCPKTWMKNSKFFHKLVDVMDRAVRKIFVTLLRYNVDKRESSYAQVWVFTRKKEDERLQKVVHVS